MLLVNYILLLSNNLLNSHLYYLLWCRSNLNYWLWFYDLLSESHWAAKRDPLQNIWGSFDFNFLDRSLDYPHTVALNLILYKLWLDNLPPWTILSVRPWSGCRNLNHIFTLKLLRFFFDNFCFLWTACQFYLFRFLYAFGILRGTS